MATIGLSSLAAVDGTMLVPALLHIIGPKLSRARPRRHDWESQLHAHQNMLLAHRPESDLKCELRLVATEAALGEHNRPAVIKVHYIFNQMKGKPFGDV